jgi:hypothetical protein
MGYLVIRSSSYRIALPSDMRSVGIACGSQQTGRLPDAEFHFRSESIAALGL